MCVPPLRVRCASFAQASWQLHVVLATDQKLVQPTFMHHVQAALHTFRV